MIDLGSLFAWSNDTELKLPVTSDTVLPGEDDLVNVLSGSSIMYYFGSGLMVSCLVTLHGGASG